MTHTILRRRLVARILSCGLLLLPLTASFVQAELAPSVYEAMQAKAPEQVRIEVLRIDASPGEKEGEQKIHVIATVSEVVKTASNLKPNDIINIVYIRTERPQGWVGPGEVPLLTDHEQTIAYLSKEDSGDYAPAAGRMSFSNF